MTTKKLYADTFPTPIGKLAVLVDERGALVRIAFDAAEAAQAFPREAKARKLELAWDKAPCREARRAIEEFFLGKRRAFDLKLNLRGTEFQLDVWRELRRIPYGKTASYGEIAKRIGRPRATRAVGQANNRNPLPIVVPCHRVIGAHGDLTGFGGGMNTKRKLLALERANA